MKNFRLDKKTYILFSIVTTVVLVLLIQSCFHKTSNQSGAEASTAYDRVLKSGTIRAGYVIYPPGSYKDPNTGKLSGIFVDALEQAASNMGLKVQWVEEVGWGSMIEGLNAGRYDIVGTQVWANSTRGKSADFTVPLFYSGIGVYVRSDNHNFDGDLSKINSSEIRIATVDGEMSSIIATQDYSKAKVVSHPQLSDDSQLLLDLTTNKADVTFVEPYIANLFLKNNPGTVRNLVSQHPIRIFPNSMMLAKGDVRFKSMMDTALTELINIGYIDKMMHKYVPSEGAFYPVATPYQVGH